MKRFLSHYTFIYPDMYLKNTVVELNDRGNILKIFPFEKEIEKTEFYSGLLIFLPEDIANVILNEISVEIEGVDWCRTYELEGELTQIYTIFDESKRPIKYRD